MNFCVRLFSNNVIEKLQNSHLRPILRPIEAIVRRIAVSKSRILFGPLKGYWFPNMERGVYVGAYEMHVQKAMTNLLKAEDIFFDIGGNYGYFSLLGAKLVGDKGHVYSFEPHPDNAQSFRKAISENEVANCTLFTEAVSNKSGSTLLYLGDGRSARPSLFPWKGNDAIDVTTITLDELLDRLRWPDLIKVDVEGAETFVLQGSSKLLSSKNAPSWIIEVHSSQNDQEVRMLLEENDYYINSLIPPEGEKKPYPYHIFASKDRSDDRVLANLNWKS